MPTTEPPARAVFVSGLVLAAGSSRRLGRPKQLLPLGDGCLLERVLANARGADLDEVVLVLGHAAEEIRAALGPSRLAGVRVAVNPEHAAGLSSSLRCGLAAVDPRAEALAVLLGDQPDCRSERIDAVLAAFRSSDAPAARAVYPDAGGAPGHPVVIRRSLWPAIAALRGDRGARDLLAGTGSELLEVPLPGSPPADVDTWDDYQALRAR